MNRRVLKYPVVAALFSATFLVGNINIINAYTYNGVNSTYDQLTYDSTDLIVTGKSNITSNKNISPIMECSEFNLKLNDNYVYRTLSTYNEWDTADGNSILDSADITLVDTVDKDSNKYINQVDKKLIFTKDANSPLEALQLMQKYGEIREDGYNTQGYVDTAIVIVSDELSSLVGDKKTSTNGDYRHIYYADYDKKFATLFPNLSKAITILSETSEKTKGWDYFDFKTAIKNASNNSSNASNTSTYGSIDTGWCDTGDSLFVYFIGAKYYNTTGFEGNISVADNSTLTSKQNIQTSKAINVTGTSKLTTATGTITGGTITSDGDIIAQGNYSAPSGKSTISAASIASGGALTASKDIKATTGSISGSVIQATSGNIIANNSIKATSKVKGNALNVGVINASSTTITGNQSISGVFTTSGQAKLNSGASLGNKKITNLGAGTLSGTSTEAVNGSQLYTINQNLASAGKAYTAGSDIAISSANAISVSKTGAIKSGDTGIITGGTVYAETNSLNTKLNGLKDLVNSHQTTISALQQQMGDLNQTISDINSKVALTTSNLANQLKNCLKSDMGNLSAAGRTAIKTIVSDSLKSMGRQSSQSLASPIATFETPSAPDTVTTKDVESVQTSLKDKLDKAALSTVSENVDINTKQIGVNVGNIHTNTSSIESLKSGKTDVSGSNIDSSAYATKLGTGSVAKGDNNLVSGDTVYGALVGKADIGYVDSGIGMMENQMAGIRQQATRDMNRVGAGASALASLHPAAYDASDKLSFATGYGHYKNANTSALGAFYHPNEKTMVSVAGTIGNNNAMLSAGVSIKLGMSDCVSKVMVTPKMFSAQQVTNENMKDHIDTQSERLHQIEMALQNR